MSPLVSKLSKTFRWIRWSTIIAILFYMFFIGLILHGTTYKLHYTLKSVGSSSSSSTELHGPDVRPAQHQQQHQLQQQTEEYAHKYPIEPGEVGKEIEKLQRASQKRSERKKQKQNQKQPTSVAEQSSAANGNNVLNTPPEAGLATTYQQQKMLRRGKEAEERGDSTMAVGVSTVVANSAAGAVQRGGMRRRAGSKSSEPETVILAASSVNEKQILEKVFKRADRDHNSQLTIQELAVYINQKIIDHIEEAIQNNPREFQRVDIAPADGLITWEEYHHFFLKEHGMTEADIDEHNEIKHTALNRKAREDMMRDKARWSEAARTDLFSLTIDEYLSFRHPESSISNLLELVLIPFFFHLPTYGRCVKLLMDQAVSH
ncbi:uncharacterized protein LOC118747883 [Rhagoletis pomonella]|uniref:uncharacterized protein LOC118747883 n=1 Tax=Rhagoletis pomonella TaxID=28610 RepID=UPI00177D68FA|nr:uncharacterized protein LOC118747883 [Rhagoletis pomonella]